MHIAGIASDDSHLHNGPCVFLAPLPQGGAQKNSELNVRFFWNRLYNWFLVLAPAHLLERKSPGYRYSQFFCLFL